MLLNIVNPNAEIREGYETYLVNTCEQARRLKSLIGEDNVKIHLDTYHMNIEEKDFYAATKLAGARFVILRGQLAQHVAAD